MNEVKIYKRQEALPDCITFFICIKKNKQINKQRCCWEWRQHKFPELILRINFNFSFNKHYFRYQIETEKFILDCRMQNNINMHLIIP